MINYFPKLDPPERYLLSAEEITESSVRLTWRPNSELGSGNSRLNSGVSVDGFVLAYARILANNMLRSNNQKLSFDSDSPMTLFGAGNGSSERTGHHLMMSDAAARISSFPIQASRSGQPNSIDEISPGDQQHQHMQQQHSMNQWQAIQLAPQQRSHQIRNLECGAAYGMRLWAFNKIGKGEPSDMITVITRGKAPVAADKRSFLSINSTQIRLQLSAWFDGGCDIYKFVVRYRLRSSPQTTNHNNPQTTAHQNQPQQQLASSSEWILVSNNIPKDQSSLLIRDLQPASHYELLVSAQNQVGNTEVKYRFSTLDENGQVVASPPATFYVGDSLGTDDVSILSDDEDHSSYDSRRIDAQWSSMGNGLSPNGRINGAGFLTMIQYQLLQSPLSVLISILMILGLVSTFLFYRFHRLAQMRSLSSLSSSSDSPIGSSRVAGPANNKSPSSHHHHHGAPKSALNKHLNIQDPTLGTNTNQMMSIYDHHHHHHLPMPLSGNGGGACSLVDSNDGSGTGGGHMTTSNTDSPILTNLGGHSNFGGSPQMAATQHQYQQTNNSSDNNTYANNNKSSNDGYQTTIGAFCSANPSSNHDQEPTYVQQQQPQSVYGHSVYAGVHERESSSQQQTIMEAGIDHLQHNKQQQQQQQQQQQCLMQMLMFAGQPMMIGQRHLSSIDLHQQQQQPQQTGPLECNEVNNNNSSSTFHGSLARRVGANSGHMIL